MRCDKEMKQIALRVSIALAAGMFSIVPVAYGAPTGGKVTTGGASIVYTDAANGGKDTNITSNTRNNIIDWQDFSKALKDINYTGALCLETAPPDSLSDDVYEDLCIVLSKIMQMLI